MECGTNVGKANRNLREWRIKDCRLFAPLSAHRTAPHHRPDKLLILRYLLDTWNTSKVASVLNKAKLTARICNLVTKWRWVKNVTHQSHSGGGDTPPEHTEREAGLDIVWSAANLILSRINPGSTVTQTVAWTTKQLTVNTSVRTSQKTHLNRYMVQLFNGVLLNNGCLCCTSQHTQIRGLEL